MINGYVRPGEMAPSPGHCLRVEYHNIELGVRWIVLKRIVHVEFNVCESRPLFPALNVVCKAAVEFESLQQLRSHLCMAVKAGIVYVGEAARRIGSEFQHELHKVSVAIVFLVVLVIEKSA